MAMGARLDRIFALVIICMGSASGAHWGILRSMSGSGGKCVHIVGDSSADNALLELVQCSRGVLGQHFDVGGWGRGYWEASGPLVFRSGRCITGDSTTPPSNPGLRATAWECLDFDHQLWTIDGSPMGAASPFRLRGSNGRCLTAESGGAYFDQSVCADQRTAPSQWFTMDRVPSVNALADVGIKNQCIHIKDDSQSDGAKLDLAACHGLAYQLTFAPDLSNYVTTPGPLKFVSGKCLTGPASNPANGVNLTSSDCVPDAPHQKWKVVGGTPFSSSFQLVGSNGKCVTAEAGGAWIDQWGCDILDRAPHQWFTVVQPNTVGILRSVPWDGLCVHIKGDSIINYAQLEMIACDPTSVGQQFDVADWGSYKFSPGRLQFVSGRCITLDWSSADNGVAALLWDCLDEDHQTFRMRSGSVFETNSFQLQAVSNGLCLNPSPADRGATFSQWECGDFSTAPQQFFSVDLRGVTQTAPPPVPRCLMDHEPCNPDDVLCCDGYYCETWGSDSVCRACISQLGTICARYGQQCCQFTSCRGVPGLGYATCQAGDCAWHIGDECGAPPLKACCAGMSCEPWQGKYVCRTPPPGCDTTGGSLCNMCCSHSCSSSTLTTSTTGNGYAQSAAAYEVAGTCVCATADNHCVYDSTCCSGKCGVNYKCID